MKTKFLKFFLFSLIITLTTCKKSKQTETHIEYKFADKEQVINCQDINAKLFNEALYSFEEDISNFYNKNGKNIPRAYVSFMRSAIKGFNLENMVSEHTVKIFKILKENDELWNLNNSKTNLNYYSNTISCIAKNMKESDLKRTFNALLSTNSLSPTLFGEPLKSSSGSMIIDKHLAMYVALDFYYAKLFDIDFSKINFDKPQSMVDFNKIPPKEPQTD